MKNAYYKKYLKYKNKYFNLKGGTGEPANGPFTNILIPNEGEYEGIMKDGQRSGKGVMEYNNGDVYEGKWLNGMRHGTGVMKFKNGDMYDGEWRNGAYHGKGTLTSSNPKTGIIISKYTGTFNNNMMDDGTLKKYDPDPAMNYLISEYKGTFNNDMMNNGTLKIYLDEIKYETSTGTFNNNIRYGEFEVKQYKNNELFSSFIGNYENDKKEGYGEYDILSGTITYHGNYHNDVFHGYGKLKLLAYEYEGDFKNGLEDGKGIKKHRDGYTYEGYFKNGKKHGEGKLTSRNMTSNGSWKDDKKNGFFNESINRCEGIGLSDEFNGYYENNKKEGYGILKDNCGKEMYDGTWKNDMKNGSGIFIRYHTKYIGEFKDDMKHGKGQLIEYNILGHKIREEQGKFENNIFIGPVN